MLWLALHFHSLSLDVFSRGTAVPDPLGVVEKQGELAKGKLVQETKMTLAQLLDRWLDNGQAAMAFVIPRGFGDDLAAGRPAKALVVVDGAESQTATLGVNYANMIAGRYAQGLVLERFDRLRGAGPKPALVEGRVRVWYNPELRSRNFMVPGVLGLILMIMTISLASMGIVREKEAGTMEQLIVTPIRPHQLIVGKLLPFVLIGLVEATFVTAVARFWFAVPVRGSFPLLLAVCLAFMFNTLGYGLFISTISRSQQQAMFTTVFFVMPMILLGGFVFPVENMPPLFQAVSRVIPTRYFFVSIRGLMLRGAGWPELWDQVAWLAGLGTLILGLSIARFKKKLD